MAKKEPLRLRVRETIASAGLASVYSPHVDDGEIWCLQQIAWEISSATSGGNTRCRLYIEGHGYKHYLEEQDGPSADTLYTYIRQPFLTPGERLALEVDEAQASTIAQIWITGYRTKKEAGIE